MRRAGAPRCATCDRWSARRRPSSRSRRQAVRRGSGAVSAVSRRRLGLGVDERVLGDEVAGLVVHPRDVALELVALDPPLAAAADLDRLELAVAHERVGLRRRDVEDLGDVGKGQEARSAAMVACHRSWHRRSGDVGASQCGSCGWPSRVVHSRVARFAGTDVIRHMSDMVDPVAHARGGSRRRAGSTCGWCSASCWCSPRCWSAPWSSPRARHTDRRGRRHPRPRRRHGAARRAICAVVDVAAARRRRAVYLGDRRRRSARCSNRAAGRGELLPRGRARRAAPRTTVSVPLAADAAPQLQRGQRIVVWLSTDDAVRQRRAAARRHGAGRARRRRAARSPGDGGQDVVLSVDAGRCAHGWSRALAIDGARDPRRRARPARAAHRPAAAAARLCAACARAPRAVKLPGPDRRRRRGVGGRLVAALERGDRTRSTIVRRCVDVVDLLAVAASGQGRAALVAAGLRRLDADAVDRLLAARRGPGRRWSPRGDAAAEDRLRALGIEHIVPDDADPRWSPSVLVEAVRAATGRGRATVAADADVRRPGDVDRPIPPGAGAPVAAGRAGPARARSIAVWGPTGAPGRTTVAVTLADELARLGRRQPAGRRRRVRRHGRGRARAARRVARAGRGLPAGRGAAPGRRGAGRAVLAAAARRCGCSPASRSPSAGRSCGRRRSTAVLAARAAAGRLHRRRLRVLPRDRRGAVLRHAGAAPQRRDPGRAGRRRPGRGRSARPTRSACSGWSAGWPSCATPRSRRRCGSC